MKYEMLLEVSEVSLYIKLSDFACCIIILTLKLTLH